MKFNKISNYIFLGLALAVALLMVGCEGLDDWSDLKSIELFNAKDETNTNQKAFKRYTVPVLSSQAVIQFIYDPSSKFSKAYNQEIRKVFDYTKLPFNSLNIQTWNSTLKVAPTTRIIIVYDTKKLNDASVEVLINFVSNGGTLFIPFANEDKRMAFLLGFKPEAEYGTDTKAMGWYFNTPVLPNMTGKSVASGN
jgi:hypothetical protein